MADSSGLETDELPLHHRPIENLYKVDYNINPRYRSGDLLSYLVSLNGWRPRHLGQYLDSEIRSGVLVGFLRVFTT